MKKKILSLFIIFDILVFIYLFGFYGIDKLNNNINGFINSNKYLAGFIYNDLDNVNGNGNLISDSDAIDLKNSKDIITGSELSFDTRNYPYYGFLTDNEKSLYKQIYANASAINKTFVVVKDIDKSNVNNVMESLYYDHPELFWLGNSYTYKYTKDGNVVQVSLSFNDTANNIESSKSKFESKANDILSKANTLSNNYEKEKYVHNALVSSVSYNEKSSLNQSAYSAIVNGSTVCAGYARAFQYLLIKLNIPCYYVVGNASGDHAWNIVKLGSGYYNVDVTWDYSSKSKYTYFNRTDSDFNSSHIRQGKSVKLPSCNATTYRGLEDKVVSNSKVDSNSSNKVDSNVTNNNIDNNNNNVNNDSNVSSNVDSSINDGNKFFIYYYKDSDGNNDITNDADTDALVDDKSSVDDEVNEEN